MDINKKTYEEYDILPYFRREWKIRPFGRDEKYKEIPDTTKPQLREWVDAFAKYQFWSRCQYEFLMAQWPFCTRKINDDIRHYVKVNQTQTMRRMIYNYAILSLKIWSKSMCMSKLG